MNPSGGEGQAATAPSIRQAPGRIATPAPRDIVPTWREKWGDR